MALGVIKTPYAQPSATSDTIVLNKEDALKVLAEGLKAKVYKEQIASLQKDKDTLLQLIELREQMIQNLTAQGETYKQLISSYQSEIKTLREMRALINGQVASLNKQIKKERRKKRWASFLGIGAAGILATLYILK